MPQARKTTKPTGTKLSRRVMRALATSEDYKLQGKHEKALEVAERILMDDPFCAEAAEEVADNLLSLGKSESAQKAATHVLNMEPKSYIANFVMGFVYSEREEWGKAIEYFRISNEGQPNNPEILRCLGWALFQDGKQAEGTAILRRALFLRGNDPAILCDLGACLLQLNDFNESITMLRAAQNLDPNDPRVQELLDVAERLQQTFMQHQQV